VGSSDLALHLGVGREGLIGPIARPGLHPALVAGESGTETILRPTVLFGKEDVLINNIAWALRHQPVFGVFGSGAYKLQPIYVDDLAEAAVQKATGKENEVVNASGKRSCCSRPRRC
jgi:uncharacterized protein YbjT (DUF2867 family)